MVDYDSCLISYCSADEVFADKLYKTLLGEGISCWKDPKEISSGGDFYEEVRSGIYNWVKVLLCCSENSLTSWWVGAEVALLFQKEQELMKEGGKNVLALIPLDLDGYLFGMYTGADDDLIRTHLSVIFRGWEHDPAIFEQGVEQVLQGLKTHGGKESSPDSKI
jgi:TIR domain